LQGLLVRNPGTDQDNYSHDDEEQPKTCIDFVSATSCCCKEELVIWQLHTILDPIQNLPVHAEEDPEKLMQKLSIVN
jgi:hypothetical protein